MIKVRGSSSAFVVNDQVHTKYPVGCLRNILLQSHLPREEIDPIHIERGALNEDLFARRIVDEGIVGPTGIVDREKNITSAIAGVDGAVFVGRCDFFLHGLSTTPSRYVEELKSTESASVLSHTIRRGEYKVENLAQLVAYMIDLQCTDGRLRYTHYKRNKKTKELSINAERVFMVSIDDTGRIMVDSEDSGYTVNQQLQHRQKCASVLSSQTIADRPYNWTAGWSSPCKFCNFRSVCDRQDVFPGTTEQFIEEARKAAADALAAKNQVKQ